MISSLCIISLKQIYSFRIQAQKGLSLFISELILFEFVWIERRECKLLFSVKNQPVRHKIKDTRTRTEREKKRGKETERDTETDTPGGTVNALEWQSCSWTVELRHKLTRGALWWSVLSNLFVHPQNVKVRCAPMPLGGFMWDCDFPSLPRTSTTWSLNPSHSIMGTGDGVHILM